MGVGNLIMLVVALVAGAVAGRFATQNMAGIPEGAVVAFVASSQCPEGWKTYDPARGRVVVGAGGNNGDLRQEVGQTGGGASSDVVITSAPDYSSDPSIVPPLEPAPPSQFSTLSTGYLPPYVILKYCVK